MTANSKEMEVERAGIRFQLSAEQGDDGKWRYNVYRLLDDGNHHEHGPVEYTTVHVQQPNGHFLRGLTDEECLEDGLLQADNWVLENVHKWLS